MQSKERMEIFENRWSKQNLDCIKNWRPEVKWSFGEWQRRTFHWCPIDETIPKISSTTPMRRSRNQSRSRSKPGRKKKPKPGPRWWWLWWWWWWYWFRQWQSTQTTSTKTKIHMKIHMKENNNTDSNTLISIWRSRNRKFLKGKMYSNTSPPPGLFLAFRMQTKRWTEEMKREKKPRDDNMASTTRIPWKLILK